MTTATAAPIARPLVRAIGARVPVATEPEHLTLAALGRPVFAITVHGDPATQGSKKAVGTRRGANGQRVPILVESAKGLPAWRGAVCAAALAAVPSGWQPLDGPLVADLIVSLPRPKSAPKTLRRLPTGYPDTEKLARAVMDALGTDAKKYGRAVVADDARITDYRRQAKVYAGDPYDTDALRQPGAVIRLWHYPPHLLEKMETPR